MRELQIPPQVFEETDGVEFIRFWVAGGSDHVSLYVGGMGDREELQWGMILADLLKHIVRGLKQRGSADSDEVLRAKIEQAYIRRLNSDDAQITGSLLGTRQ